MTRAIETAQLARDYRAGVSLLTLAQRHGICHSAILYRLRRFGVEMRRCGAPNGNQNARRGRLRYEAPPSDPLPEDGPGDPIPGDPGYEYPRVVRQKNKGKR